MPRPRARPSAAARAGRRGDDAHAAGTFGHQHRAVGQERQRPGIDQAAGDGLHLELAGRGGERRRLRRACRWRSAARPPARSPPSATRSRVRQVSSCMIRSRCKSSRVCRHDCKRRDRRWASRERHRHVTLIDSTVSVTIRHSDSEPIASEAATALDQSGRSNGRGRLSKPAPRRATGSWPKSLQGAGKSPATHCKFAAIAGKIAAARARTWRNRGNG